MIDGDFEMGMGGAGLDDDNDENWVTIRADGEEEASRMMNEVLGLQSLETKCVIMLFCL